MNSWRNLLKEVRERSQMDLSGTPRNELSNEFPGELITRGSNQRNLLNFQEVLLAEPRKKIPVGMAKKNHRRDPHKKFKVKSSKANLDGIS